VVGRWFLVVGFWLLVVCDGFGFWGWHLWFVDSFAEPLGMRVILL
jgi:hypothetical protein